MSTNSDPPVSRLHTDRAAVVVAAVAIGGALGATARYAMTVRLPTHPGDFPTTTLLINFIGAALIGVLNVALTERITTFPWVRPLLGTGVLGGFTTFSTAMTDAVSLHEQHMTTMSAVYTIVSLAGTVTAAFIAIKCTHSVLRATRR